MLEKHLIKYCSPTLASLKSGSLFNCRCSDDEEPERLVSEWNNILGPRGVRLCILRRTSGAALIYVYRLSDLSRVLGDSDARDFLRKYGYGDCFDCSDCTASECCLENCLNYLKSRIADTCGSEDSFPHEIGVFLGYPLADVSGFIRNKGRNCKLNGHWKVYGDPEHASELFSRFEKCRSVYGRLWSSGKRSVPELTVAG